MEAELAQIGQQLANNTLFFLGITFFFWDFGFLPRVQAAGSRRVVFFKALRGASFILLVVSCLAFSRVCVCGHELGTFCCAGDPVLLFIKAGSVMMQGAW